MYTPQAFAVADVDQILAFIEQNPFAMVIGAAGHIAHLPLYRLADGKIHGHCAAANPLAQQADGLAATAVFRGPHAYISPRYYATSFNVPTWNYAAVHASGIIRYIDDADETWDLLSQMVALSEAAAGDQAWHLPNEERYRALLPGLRFFELADVSFTASFKFNQNKGAEDIASVIAQLQQHAPDAAAFMSAICKSP